MDGRTAPCTAAMYTFRWGAGGQGGGTSLWELQHNNNNKSKGYEPLPNTRCFGLCVCVCVVCVPCVSVHSISRNDVSRVAQRYGTIAAHTQRRASILVVFVVFCVHMHSFAGLIRRTPPTTFSDTAITDRHSDTTIFQLWALWVQISWSIGSEKIVRTCAPPVGVEPSTSCVQGERPIHYTRLSAFCFDVYNDSHYITCMGGHYRCASFGLKTLGRM